jgi:hypothetical protein
VHKFWKDAGSFGGPKWAKIAQAGRMYFDPKVPKVVFLDHVVDLSHNGGLFLGKTTKWFESMGGYYLKLLDLKRNSSVFKSRVGLFVSSETERLVKKAKGLKLIEVECPVKKVKMVKHERVVYSDKVIPVRTRHKVLKSREAIEVLMEECVGYDASEWEDFWKDMTPDSWANLSDDDVKKVVGVESTEYDLLEEGVEAEEEENCEDECDEDSDDSSDEDE